MIGKLFITPLVSLLLLLFPYNIIGCSGGPDPYDYYLSFFDPRNGAGKEYTPFIYTTSQFLYEDEEPADQLRATNADWEKYLGLSNRSRDVDKLTLGYSVKTLTMLRRHAAQGSTGIPDSLKKNALVQVLLRQRDQEAFTYLIFLRNIESSVSWKNYWEPPVRDSLRMNTFISSAEQAYQSSRNNFFRQRWAYQVMRLALYNKQPLKTLQWLAQARKFPVSPSIGELVESLHAGALMRAGKPAESVYEAAQYFHRNRLKKLSLYQNYHIYGVSRVKEEQVLRLCRNNEEKASVLALIFMGNPQCSVETLRRISNLSPQHPLLDQLTVREINKLEDSYLTPRKGKGDFDYGYFSEDTVTDQQVRTTAAWMEERFDQANQNKGLYAVGAAYLHFMLQDYTDAGFWLKKARTVPLSSLLKDQWELTSLLVAVNESPGMSRAVEDKILPGVEWLETKARQEENRPYWQQYYRNFFNNVLAPRYRLQQMPEEFLARGTADNMVSPGYYSTLYKLREQASARDLKGLIELLRDSGNQRPLVRYMIQKTSFGKDDIVDLAGTCYLREHKPDSALYWFKQLRANYYQGEPYSIYLRANPFADLILDSHAPTDQDTVMYNRKTYTERILQLLNLFHREKSAEAKARAAYELAKGYYNTTYWGNSWLMVNYSWSGAEDRYRPATPLPWKDMNYYTAAEARKWYHQAADLSSDPELKARATFMLAKCRQKQVEPPRYESFRNYEDYEEALQQYQQAMLADTLHFTRLFRTYQQTAFYKDAYEQCSYLRDFVQSIKN